ncbi:hypothetical protein L208DRAFT_1377816 [Tricholoma matsutake]|nr:hypothetical protein L208DRAFT_1377816 [Tricholoma matsutake 945]
MQPNPSTPCTSQVPGEEPASPTSPHTLGKLFRAKSGSSASNPLVVSSPDNPSRSGFIYSFSPPPTPAFPPRIFTSSLKRSRRKSTVSTDASAQSSSTAVRSRALSHSLSSPTLWSSDSTSVNRRGSRRSVVTQEHPNSSSSALIRDSDDAPLITSLDCAGRNWNSKWKRRCLFKSTSITSSAPYPVSNSSTSTLGSIQTKAAPLRHHSKESKLPSIQTPLTPPFSSGSHSSMTEEDPPLTPVSLTESTFSFRSQKNMAVRRRGNLAKLVRTLGVLPGELDYPSDFGESPASAGFTPKSFTDDLGVPPRTSGRLSLSLANITSFFRPPYNRRKPTPLPHPPMPTQSLDDLHRFTFTNNLINPHATTNTSPDSPISPITFCPSIETSPVMGPDSPQYDDLKHKQGVPMDQSRDAVPSLPSSPTLVNSSSHTRSRVDSGSSVESKAQRHTLYDEQVQLPEISNWLGAPSPMHQVSGPEYMHSRRDSHPTQAWSGEWNQDDMQYVINRLRTLK